MDPRYVHAFVLKLWLERAENPTRSEWRGRIDHIQSATRLYFRDLDEMMEFIQSHLGTTVNLDSEDKKQDDGIPDEEIC